MTLDGNEKCQSKSASSPRTSDRNTAQCGNAGAGKKSKEAPTCRRQDPGRPGLRCRNRTVADIQARRGLHQPLFDDPGDAVPQLGHNIACAFRGDRCYKRPNIGGRFATKKEPGSSKQADEACTQTLTQELTFCSSRTGLPINHGKPTHELGYGIRIPRARSTCSIAEI